MGDDVIRIEINKGGYSVSILDPKIQESNNSPKSPYTNPWVEYQFESVEGVTAFIEEVLPTLKPEDKSNTFDAAFKRAVSEDESQEDSK